MATTDQLRRKSQYPSSPTTPPQLWVDLYPDQKAKRSSTTGLGLDAIPRALAGRSSSAYSRSTVPLTSREPYRRSTTDVKPRQASRRNSIDSLASPPGLSPSSDSDGQSRKSRVATTKLDSPKLNPKANNSIASPRPDSGVTSPRSEKRNWYGRRQKSESKAPKAWVFIPASHAETVQQILLMLIR